MEEENAPENPLIKYKVPLLISLVGLVLLIGGVASSGIIPRTFIRPQKSFNSQNNIPKLIKVDVSGAVKNPGVYDLPFGSITKDAVLAAGGVIDQADPDYLSKKLNLAQKLNDGMKIYIPFTGESTQNFTNTNLLGSFAEGGVVSINLGTLAELDSLPGIGPTTAQKIIDKRPYNDIAELLSKKAVTKSLYDKIKDKVSL